MRSPMTVATLLPAAVIGLRMLRAIPGADARTIPVLDDFLRSVAQEPKRWHYWTLICGLALILMGSVMSSVAACPFPAAAADTAPGGAGDRAALDRTSGVEGKRVSGRVELG